MRGAPGQDSYSERLVGEEGLGLSTGGVGAHGAAEGQLTGAGHVGLQVGVDQGLDVVRGEGDGHQQDVLLPSLTQAFNHIVRLGAEPLHGPHLEDPTPDRTTVSFHKKPTCGGAAVLRILREGHRSLHTVLLHLLDGFLRPAALDEAWVQADVSDVMSVSSQGVGSIPSLLYPSSSSSESQIRIEPPTISPTGHLSKLVEGAVFLLDVVLSEPLDGFRVGHPLERPLGWFEVLGGEKNYYIYYINIKELRYIEKKAAYGVDVVEQLSGGGLQHSVHHVTHQVLQSVQQVFKRNEGTLGLDVSAGAGLLRPVGLGDGEGVPQGGDAGLQVELRGLRQVRLLAKVVQVKERGAALHLRLHQAHAEHLGHVLPSDQHVSVVQLHIHVRLLVQEVVGPASRAKPISSR
ncbi:hypothetical protein F7725_015239, partial [Dissostichus mawsoni]